MSEEEVPEPIRSYLETDDALLDAQWQQTLEWLTKRFGQQPKLEAILFLIGIQSLGRGFEPDIPRDRKQDVIMEGTYCVFETVGLYHRIGLDAEGNWLWEPTVAHVPKLPMEQQEKLLKVATVRYFQSVLG